MKHSQLLNAWKNSEDIANYLTSNKQMDWIGKLDYVCSKELLIIHITFLMILDTDINHRHNLFGGLNIKQIKFWFINVADEYLVRFSFKPYTCFRYSRLNFINLTKKKKKSKMWSNSLHAMHTLLCHDPDFVPCSFIKHINTDIMMIYNNKMLNNCTCWIKR